MVQNCNGCVDWRKMDEKKNFIKNCSFGAFFCGVIVAFFVWLVFSHNFTPTDFSCWAGSILFLLGVLLTYYLINNVLDATTLYFFLDKDGRDHCHNAEPIAIPFLKDNGEKEIRRIWCNPGVKLDNPAYNTKMLSDYIIADTILVVQPWRKNGTNSVRMGCGRVLILNHQWTIERVLPGRHSIEIMEKYTQNGYTLSPHDAIRIIDLFDNPEDSDVVRTILTYKENFSNLSRSFCEIQEDGDKTLALLTQLGYGVMGVHDEIEGTKAWSQSPVGKLARKMLAELINELPEDMRDDWRKQHSPAVTPRDFFRDRFPEIFETKPKDNLSKLASAVKSDSPNITQSEQT